MNKTISDAELEVMRVLWQNKRAMTLAELRTEIMQIKDWNKSTVHTLVNRLRDTCAVNRIITCRYSSICGIRDRERSE